MAQQVTSRGVGSCAPTPKTTIMGTYVIIGDMSQPFVQPDPVYRVYEGGLSGILCRWKQIDGMDAHMVPDTKRCLIFDDGERGHDVLMKVKPLLPSRLGRV